MSFKLAFRNVHRSVRNYLIYFLTLTFGICIFYIFNSLESQQAMLAITESEKEAFEILTDIMNYVSIMVTLILGFLVLYANRFLIRRRKKEMGVYLVLGMSKGQVALILMLETLLIGILSLAVGLVLGVFLSQGMAVLTAKLFSVSFVEFVFVFSKSACLKTLGYFSLIFLLVMLFNTVSVSNIRLIDLLTAEHKNETLKGRRLGTSVVLFIFSVICLGASYYLIVKNGMLNINWEFGLCLALGTLGTLLFFRSLSGFLLRLSQASRGFYLHGLNAFILRQLNSKINTVWVSMSMICIMLLITIGTLSSAIGLADVLTRSTEMTTPYDLSISLADYTEDSLTPNPLPLDVNALSAFQAEGLDLSNVSAISETRLRSSGLTYNAIDPDFYQGVDSSIFNAEAIESFKNTEVPVLSLSDFNRHLTMQGKPAVTLEGNQYLVFYDFDATQASAKRLANRTDPITIAGSALTGSGTLCYQSVQTSFSSANPAALVVPDVVAEQLPVLYLNLDMNFKTPGEDSAVAFMTQFDQIRTNCRALYPDNPLYSYLAAYFDKASIESSNFTLKIMVSYVGIYVGLIFLIASAAVLALQQLSEAADNQARYALLRKLGTEEGMIRRALFTQIALYFFLPLALALVHSFVGIRVANDFIAIFASVDVASNSLMTAILLLIIYGGYFICTWLGSLAMIKDN